MTALLDHDLADISGLLDAGELSSVELVTACLDAIEAAQKLNAFVAIYPEAVHESARQLDAEAAKSGRRGPLHGVPVVVKDNCDIAGKPTSGGSRAFLDNVAAVDAGCVRKLLAAGAIILAKTNMHEMAYGGTGEVSHFGPGRNPWNPQHIAGGSSSGSGVAVAGRVVPAAIGSDTGGSVRIPAAACGVTGLKPTYGRVSRAGVMPLSWSLDHVGPLTRSARDARLLLDALAGPDDQDPASVTSTPAEGAAQAPGLIRVARFPTYALHPEVERAFTDALRVFADLGYRMETFDLTEADEAHVAWLAIMYPEATSCYQNVLAERFADLAPSVRTQLEAGKHISAQQYLNAQRFRARYIELFTERMRDAQAIVMPSLPVPAPRIGQGEVELPNRTVSTQDAMTFTNLTANMLGWPAVSVPCGFSRDRLPVGLTVMTEAFADEAALGIADAYQAASDWHHRKPDVPVT